jgi:hypothetical protein
MENLSFISHLKVISQRESGQEVQVSQPSTLPLELEHYLKQDKFQSDIATRGRKWLLIVNQEK